MALTRISREPKVAKNAVDVVSRINPKYHFPGDLKLLERQMRISLGLPFKGKMGGQIAYGYTYDETQDSYFPINDIFRLLWEARRYLYTSSLREVCNWINVKAKKLGYDVEVSHQGLRNIMILRPPFEECLLPLHEKEEILKSLCQWNNQ